MSVTTKYTGSWLRYWHTFGVIGVFHGLHNQVLQYILKVDSGLFGCLHEPREWVIGSLGLTNRGIESIELFWCKHVNYSDIL